MFPKLIRSHADEYVPICLMCKTFHSSTANVCAIWQLRRAKYNTRAPVAMDIFVVSASQAFVQKAFSAYGLLSRERRNRIHK